MGLNDSMKLQQTKFRFRMPFAPHRQAGSGASTESEASTAATTLLSAVGNNHAGTYYPIVLEVVLFLREILESGSDWARTAVLNVLIDQVRPGTTIILGANDNRISDCG